MFRRLFGYKPVLLAGLFLNIALFVYVYFIVDGGPSSIRQDGGWLAIFNEVPITLLFFLASVFKPYLMVWSKCRENPGLIASAGWAMLISAAIATLIAILAAQVVMKNIVLYINWALLWVISAYYVLAPQQDKLRKQ